jgi:hypothetical protein
LKRSDGAKVWATVLSEVAQVRVSVEWERPMWRVNAPSPDHNLRSMPWVWTTDPPGPIPRTGDPRVVFGPGDADVDHCRFMEKSIMTVRSGIRNRA